MSAKIQTLRNKKEDIMPRTVAQAVYYDNSTSGLEAENIQDAINELKQNGSSGNNNNKKGFIVIGTSLNGYTKNDCDYLCDGTDDDIEIQAAINNSKKENILILPGIYNLSSEILLDRHSCEKIIGSGINTILQHSESNQDYRLLSFSRQSLNCSIQDLYIRDTNFKFQNEENDSLVYIQEGIFDRVNFLGKVSVSPYKRQVAFNHCCFSECNIKEGRSGYQVILNGCDGVYSFYEYTGNFYLNIDIDATPVIIKNCGLTTFPSGVELKIINGSRLAPGIFISNSRIHFLNPETAINRLCYSVITNCYIDSDNDRTIILSDNCKYNLIINNQMRWSEFIHTEFQDNGIGNIIKDNIQ